MSTVRVRGASVLLLGALTLGVASSSRPVLGQESRIVGADSITEASIRAHMEFLASDALNGRGSGTRDEWIAATYIASHMRRWGLEPMGDGGGYVQTIEIMRDTAAAPPVLTAGTSRFTHGKEMLVLALTSARVSGPLLKFTGDAVPAGSIVLMPEAPATPAANAGAAAVLTLATPAAVQTWETRAARPLTTAARMTALPPPTTPAAARAVNITLNKDAHAALAALAEGTVVTLEAELKPSPSYSWNAVGRLTGIDPPASGEVIVLGAHLDHVGARPAMAGQDTIFNGADDDASGTVAVMELAQALTQGPRPKRTLVFALFGSEEAGGYGAGYFVELPVVPLDRMVAQIQFEMIARPDPMVPAHTLWLTGYERSNLGPELAKQGAKLVQDPHPEQSFFTRSDNIRFARKGVIAHTVSSFNLHKEYHQATDELRFVDYAHMLDSIRSMLEPVRWLANSTFKPEWAPNGRPR